MSLKWAEIAAREVGGGGGVLVVAVFAVGWTAFSKTLAPSSVATL